MKEEVKTEELNEINGGSHVNQQKLVCRSCHKVIVLDGTVEKRDVGSGCDTDIEVKCPYCGDWTSCDFE